ncbi:hypothetical protein NE237_003459 [Protea cynaroides]|uniref:RNase H type-1 domain-containing protein n=1 Tax=Protea cynaroides TaxID=273540 RepID=A0A9Q0QSG3_9MAGN|nr:hypothetical protein NE237_003459 [Protea cynaroides]
MFSFAPLKAPGPDGLRYNFDAALKLNSTSGGVGFVLSGPAGTPFLAVSHNLSLAVSQNLSFPSPIIGETLALRLALSEAVFHGFQFIMMESDNLEIINMIRGVAKEDYVYVRPIVQNILSLAEHGEEVSFHHVPRSANQVEHSLARRAVTV